MMLLLAACSSAPPTPPTPPQPELTLGLAVSATDLDFGEVTLGGTATAELEVTNTSSAAVALSFEAEGLDVDAPDTLEVGDSPFLSVAWTPVSEDALATMLVLTAAAGDQSFELDVPVSGTVGVPDVNVERDAVAFGEVEVGCTSQRLLNVYSSGDAPLTIRAWTLDGPSQLELLVTNRFGTYDDPPELPWLVSPRQLLTLLLEYRPTATQAVDAHLVLTTDDPDEGTVDIAVTATGTVTTHDLTIQVAPAQNVTAIIAVNEEVVWGPSFHDRLFLGLPALFETLSASGLPYRIAFTGTLDGAVSGDVPFIDETTDPAAIVDIVEAMVPNTGTDNDELLPTLEAAIAAQSAWLFEDAGWSASRLSLVGINYDMEQSSGSAVGYVDSFQAYKADPTDIAVHAIAGEYPSGCGAARPSEPFWTAAELTGGIYLSICEPDWTPLMEELAEGLLGEPQRFTLDEADPATIEVWLDGITNTDWTYTDGELVFDPPPPAGSEVRVTYVELPECE